MASSQKDSQNTVEIAQIASTMLGTFSVIADVCVWKLMTLPCVQTCGTCLEFESCLLSGIEKRPPLGGYLYISTIVISVRNTAFVRCREVVRFSEGPLWEVRLYHCKEGIVISTSHLLSEFQVSDYITCINM